MITGNFPLNDEQVQELQTQVNAYLNRATDYHDGELASRARLGYDYYYGELPAPITKGSSKTVSRDVWDGVNGVLQELISTFASNTERPVKFSPLHAEDGLAAEAATELVNKVMLQLNPGYAVMTESFKEALIARNGFIKRYWKEWTKTQIEEFTDMTREQFDQYLASIKGEVIEYDLTVMKGEAIVEGVKVKKAPKGAQKPTVEKFEGHVVYETKHEGAKIEYVPFEEVIIDPTARSLCDANFICHRVRKSKHELLEMGFDPEKVANLPTSSLDYTGVGVELSRNNGLQPRALTDGVYTGDPKADKVWLYEAYQKSSVGSDRCQILQVFSCMGEVLEVNIVNEQPFHTFTPFPTPGQVWGESVFDILKDIQDLKSNLRRGMIDNINNANFRRYIGVKGGYVRESLLNNRPGGVIEVNTDPAALQPMPFHQLPQGIDVMLNMLDDDKERRTGTSKIAQGLDPNVFKNDNSTATVGMMMTAALNRMRMVARNIANYGLIPLYMGIYDLYRLNGKEPIEVETSRGRVAIDPRQLPERDHMTVAVAVGNGEKAERAQKLQTALMMFSQIPQAQAFFQQDNAFAMVKDILESLNVGDVSQYLTPPDQLPPPQPDPMQQAQLAIMQKQVEQLDTQNQKIVHDIQMLQQKQEFEQESKADEMHMKMEQAKSQQDQMADATEQQARANDIAEKRLVLDSRKLDLKEKELLIQAQMENQQQRPVSFRG